MIDNFLNILYQQIVVASNTRLQIRKVQVYVLINGQFYTIERYEAYDVRKTNELFLFRKWT